MKKNNLVWVGAIIIVFVIGAGVFLYIPYQIRRERLQEKADERQMAEAREIHGGKGLAGSGVGGDKAKKSKSKELPTHPSQKIAILEDGSFNFIPPRLLTENEVPETIGADMDWRERYEAALTSASLTAEEFYVYPFNDETKEGVGTAMTYGAHTSVGAMLAATTNVTLVHDNPPTKWGLPELTEENPDGILERAEYEKRALGDEATGSAEVFILGTYTDGTEPNSVKLEAWAVRRDKPKERIALYEGTTTLPEGRVDAKGSSFHNQATQQRECMMKIAGGIVEKGLAAKREPNLTAIPDLDKELREIALVLNANDSQPVMDAIDRALALAALRPDSTAPLQAAAYGIHMLNTIMLDLIETDAHSSDYGMRTYGLAQAALAQNDRPELSRLLYACGCLMVGHSDNIRYLAFSPGATNAHVLDELTGLAEMVVFNRQGLSQYQMAQFMPDWLVLMGEMRVRWFLGRDGQFRDYFNRRLELAGDFDFFHTLFIKRYYDYRYIEEGEHYFTNQRHASTLAMDLAVAREAAAVLVAPSIRSNPDEILKELGRVLGHDLSRLRNPVKAGRVHEIRAHFLELSEDWGEPESGNHPGLAALGVLAKVRGELHKHEENRARKTPFAGMEFTPVERVRLMQRANARGMLILDKFYGESFGSYEDTIRVAEAYFKVVPDNAAAWLEHAEYIYGFPGYPDNASRRFQAIQKAHEHRLLETTTWYKLGRATYFAGNSEEGLRLLKHYNRADPFVPERFTEMAEFCKRYGMRSDAVKFYDHFLASHPERYDIRNDRSWALCHMGRWNDNGLGQMFAEAVNKLTGNGSFHTARLQYLVNWQEDWKAAREAANRYARNKPVDAALWLSRIELEEGNKVEAARMLDEIKPVGYKGLSLADFHADVAQRFIGMEQLDKAAEHVRKAAAVDDWKASVIQVMGDLHQANKDYKSALEEYERYIERYGPGEGVEDEIALCQHKLGRTELAIRLLEPMVFEKSKHQFGTDVALALLQIRTEEKNKNEARRVFDRILESSQLFRWDVESACKIYGELDKTHAEEVLGRVNEIMAGPSVFFDDTPPNTLPPGVVLTQNP